MAACKNSESLVEALIRRGDTSLEARDQVGQAFVAIYLSLDRQIDLQIHGILIPQYLQEGFTALHAATVAGSVGGVRALLRAGANAHSKAAEGGTPLHYAAMTNQLETARVLVEEGHAQVRFRATVRLLSEAAQCVTQMSRTGRTAPAGHCSDAEQRRCCPISH